ncbi:MAG: PKD domain-containing protein, partial [Candidatus Omnitrophica bacterium]|nr:PKD domain-containing protein [Candidatus Omnitrophota bacterium]
MVVERISGSTNVFLSSLKKSKNNVFILVVVLILSIVVIGEGFSFADTAVSNTGKAAMSAVSIQAGPGSVFSQFAGKHGTGSLLMTPEQRKAFHKKHTRIKKVHVNGLGLKRINQERKRNHLSSLDQGAALPAGQEIESALEANASATPATTSPSTNTPSVTALPQTTAASLAPGTSQVASIPATVDNSIEPWFPVIGDQGNEGSCVAFASTYYQLTYMYAASKGWTVGSDPTKIFSPKWSYNLTNGGYDSGTSNGGVFHILETNGAVTWAQFPYDATPTQQGDYRAWDLNPDDWQAALSARINLVQYVGNVSTPSGLNMVKQLLANGYILSFDTDIYGWQLTHIKQDPTTTIVSPYIGQWAASWVTYGGSGHSMTIVGYDDNVWIDINGNGVVDPGERGAFKIANSWGTNFGNAGFIWLAYDALNAVSVVSNAPNYQRQGAFTWDEVFEFNVKPNYTPKMIAKFTVNTLDRSQLTMFLGTSATSASSPTVTWYSNALNTNPVLGTGGGPYAFNGTNVAVPATFVLDFTDILPSTNIQQKYYLGMSNNDTTKNTPSTLSSYQLIDLSTKTTLSQGSLSLPVTADGQTVYSSISYTFNSLYPPIAIATASPPWGVAPMSVKFDASHSTDSNGTIVSYTWDFGDGTTGSGQTISHVYNSSGTFNTMLTVTDNQGLIGIGSVSVTATEPLPSVPTGLSATGGNGQVALTWTSSPGLLSYTVLRGTASGSYTRTFTSISSSFTDTTATNGTKYYYVVQANNATGSSANSSEVSAIPVLPLPSVPTITSFTAGNATVSLGWTSSALDTGYTVKRGTTSGSYDTSLNTTALNYTDNTVSNGTTYYYTVSASNTGGSSAN